MFYDNFFFNSAQLIRVGTGQHFVHYLFFAGVQSSGEKNTTRKLNTSKKKLLGLKNICEPISCTEFTSSTKASNILIIIVKFENLNFKFLFFLTFSFDSMYYKFVKSSLIVPDNFWRIQKCSLIYCIVDPDPGSGVYGRKYCFWMR